MMIKGSLLRSIPIVNRFSASENGAKIGVLGVLEVENFNPNNQTPLGNQSPPKQVIWRKKRCRSMQKCGL